MTKPPGHQRSPRRRVRLVQAAALLCRLLAARFEPQSYVLHPTARVKATRDLRVLPWENTPA
jgi:hypothetical protein